MRKAISRTLGPALLVLFLSAAGSGVPGLFAQTAASGKSGTKRKANTGPRSSVRKSSPSSQRPVTKGSSGKSAAKSSTANTPASKTSSSRTTGKSSAGKKGAVARSRRQPGQKAPTSDRISEIQAALAKDGSFGGAPSGKWDDDTAAAMRKFQAAHGLTPTGKLDALTLQKLGLGSQTAGVAAPVPPPGAVSRLTSSNSYPSTTSGPATGASSAEAPRRQ